MAPELKEVVNEVIEQNSGTLYELSSFLWSHPELALQETQAHELTVRFRGRAAHAAASPWDGLNALDAAVSAYNNIGLLRQQIKPSSSIHGVISEGGKYPNIIPEATEMRLFVHSSSTEDLMECLDKVEACFRGAAEAAGCTVSVEKLGTYLPVIHNATISNAYRKHAHSLGVSFVDDVVKNMPTSGASTDCGNVSHRIPAVHPMFGLGQTAAARVPMNHTREFTEWAGLAESQAPTLRAAKIMALTVLDLFTDHDLLIKAKEEFSSLSILSEKELQTLVS
ncbi:hypothetical protein HPB48_002821 [Haemaphysalis longicornis]|uniref:Peptidase M20 dimerisation domain-containing protein n=1 Tax=Haemaphysalis longicornis TaxID=44386 RepID=A0A9J6GIG5_HAELO|nr:hypothetical protein HPB48_002821 [Haemaphysalis longicornis]